jgi:hypothetical protein
MTHQKKLHNAKCDSDAAIAQAQLPGLHVTFDHGWAGFTAVDQSERRTVQGTLTVEGIDQLIDDLLFAREHIMNNMPTATNWEIPKP